MKNVMVLTRSDNNSPIIINTTAIAVVEPTRYGTKIITTLVKSKYEGFVDNVEYVVREPIQTIISLMNNM